MKTCNTCHVEKEPAEFYGNKAAPDGLQYKCKACTTAYNLANKAKRNARSAAWSAQNQERMRELRAAWQRENKAARVAACSARRQRVRKTLPFADMPAIRAIYALAKKCRDLGIAVEVDHIVPLRHPKVCGLHVAANLTLLDDDSNRLKGNRWQSTL